MAEQRGDQIGQADADVGNRREQDQRLPELEWKEPSFEPQARHEHQRERDEKDQPYLPAAHPEMPGARHEPGNGGDQVFVGGWP